MFILLGKECCDIQYVLHLRIFVLKYATCTLQFFFQVRISLNVTGYLQYLALGVLSRFLHQPAQRVTLKSHFFSSFFFYFFVYLVIILKCLCKTLKTCKTCKTIYYHLQLSPNTYYLLSELSELSEFSQILVEPYNIYYKINIQSTNF